MKHPVPLLSQVLMNLWEPKAYKADYYSNTYKFLVLSITNFKNKKLNEIFQNSVIGT
jgi:hypothetical protein